MTRWVRAIKRGWVVTDRVPGPDVDEFAEATDVVAALAGPRGGRDTLLAVQHPHRTPWALAEGLTLADALPAARQALDRLRASAYRPVAGVVAPYRVEGPDGVAVCVLCLVDSAAVDMHGMSWVRQGEQVYHQVVVERAAMLEDDRHQFLVNRIQHLDDNLRVVTGEQVAEAANVRKQHGDPTGLAVQIQVLMLLRQNLVRHFFDYVAAERLPQQNIFLLEFVVIVLEAQERTHACD